MCLLTPFLIIPWAPTITRTVVVLRCQIYCYFSLQVFFFSHQSKLMVFHWSLSDNKSLQISWILLSTLVDLTNAAVWMVSAPPLISNSSGSLYKHLLPIFFSSLARSKYLSSVSFSFTFTLWFVRTTKSRIRQVLFFSFC